MKTLPEYEIKNDKELSCIRVPSRYVVVTSHEPCDPERDLLGGKLPHFRQGCTSENLRVDYITTPPTQTAVRRNHV